MDDALPDALADAPPPLWVVCLCAEWCNVCRDWRAIFDEAARAHPETHFAWVDVEDEDEAMGDVDIETFPTILIARGKQALFLGPVQPSSAQLSRLIASTAPSSTSNNVTAGAGVTKQAHALLARLQAAVLPKL